MSNLAVMATYWNEADWIESSLKQISSIEPEFIVICEGNFDPRFNLHSNDGTKEIINAWVNKRENALVISPVRKQKKEYLLKPHLFQTDQDSLPFKSILRLSQSILRNHLYRINQAATFAKMARLINLKMNINKPKWLMTYDADQFYSDALINFFKKSLNKVHGFQTCALEKTFFHNFSEYTTSYEQRRWNNMPFRFEPGMTVFPTRHFSYKRGKSHIFTYKENLYETNHQYMHYKFRKSSERDYMTYNLGDRKPPEDERVSGPYEKCTKKDHNEIIQSLISNGWGKDYK